MKARRVFFDAARERQMFQGADEEMQMYLSISAHRFDKTLKLVERVAPPGSRVLEIGANPYFVTAVLLHDLRLDTVCMGRPSVVWPGASAPDTGTTERFIDVDGATYPVRELVCNAEKDRFPIESNTFDLVIAAEVLEHLIFSPTHFLAEIHRVLRPGGHLLLTTPNAAQLRYLVRWIKHRSVWDQYSGYGVYGRHQREYTAPELHELLVALGYVVEQTDNYYSERLNTPLESRALGVLYRFLPGRAPEMTFLARADGEPRISYPPFLYRSLYPQPTDLESMLAFANRDGKK